MDNDFLIPPYIRGRVPGSSRGALRSFNLGRSGYYIFKCEETPFEVLRRALYMALQKGDLEAVKTAIDKGFGIEEFITEWDGNALELACGKERFSNIEIVRYLLEAGASTQVLSWNSDFTTKESVLYIACCHGNIDIIALLLSQSPPPPVDMVGPKGDTPLHRAAAWGSERAVRLLLDAGAKIKPNDCGRTPLHNAARSGSKVTVQLLFDAGAELHPAGSQSSLFGAVEGGHYEVTLFLLRQGCLCDLEERDPVDGTTPLMASVGWGSVRLGNNPSNPKRDVWDEEREKVVWLLIKSGANVLVMDNKQMTMLHHAARLGALSLVQYLIDKGVDANVKSLSSPLDELNDQSEELSGSTALHYASMIQNEPIVRILLDSGAHISEVDDFHRNALHHAVWNWPELDCSFIQDLDEGLRIYDTAKLLLERGIAVGAHDCFGHTPLHGTVIRSGGDLVGATMLLLLEYGADINALDNMANSPLMMACRDQHFWKMRLLRLYGADVTGLDEAQKLEIVYIEGGIDLEQWYRDLSGY